MSRLAGKKILLGVSGGIAAYKTPELVRLLQKRGAEVRVAMTPNAQRFVSPLVLSVLSGSPVYADLFQLSQVIEGQSLIEHTSGASWADVMVLAPATANLIARSAAGMADDPVTTLLLAFDGPVLVCPSMNTRMLNHPATRMNLDTLEDLGYSILEPDEGELACGDYGAGRMPNAEVIAEAIEGLVAPKDLLGQRVIVTAGPTRERIDAMRFLSNRSSGKMGYAIAIEARRRGAEVTLVTGPTSLPDPPFIETIRVITAREMQKEVVQRAAEADIIIKNAAVADFRPKSESKEKLKKSKIDLQIELTPNPDILAGLGKKKTKGQFLVGFAAESRLDEKEAARKLKAKKMDLIVLNAIAQAVDGERTQATFIDSAGEIMALEPMDKSALARHLFDKIADLKNPKRKAKKRTRKQ